MRTKAKPLSAATLQRRFTSSEAERLRLTNSMARFYVRYQNRNMATPKVWEEHLESFAQECRRVVPMACPADAPYESNDDDDGEAVEDGFEPPGAPELQTKDKE